MTIQYCSDLHLEFNANKQFLEENPLVPAGDILILAGDIILFSMLNKSSSFFDIASGNFKAVYWVPGNHEYYRYDIANKSGKFCEQIRENVFLLNNYTVELDGIQLIFSTMWSVISPNNYWVVQQSISDFREIRYNGRLFTPNHFNLLHAQSKDFLQSALLSKKKNAKTVVVTHHVPTFLNYPPQYADDPVSEAFGVELFNLIEQSGPDFWIYGHHHSNTPPFVIGNTQLITNQLGYVEINEHKQFNNKAILTFS